MAIILLSLSRKSTLEMHREVFVEAAEGFKELTTSCDVFFSHEVGIQGLGLVCFLLLPQDKESQKGLIAHHLIS